METDLIVIEKVKNGDLNAFSELVLRHQKNLLRLALRVTGDLVAAEDVVQEAYVRWHQAETAEVRNVEAWLGSS